MFHEKTDDGQKRIVHERIKSKIRTVPNWPKNGVMFRDITTLLQDAPTFNHTIELLKERYINMEIDMIVGVESRGFIIGSALAHALRKGFVPIRKKGKLPHHTESQEYELEYGTDIIEIHKDAIKPGDKVLLVDDLLATGGTALAACILIERMGETISECCFVIDLPELEGRKRLEESGHMVFSLVEFEGE
jgi:adenine phosphoribosyltransferase